MKTGGLTLLLISILPVVLVHSFGTHNQAVNKYDEEVLDHSKRSPKNLRASKKGEEDDGVCGCQCRMGAAGSPGLPGVPGQPGTHGMQGREGEKGQKGQAGDTGLTGVTGEIGPVGPSGTRGRRGEKGSQGHVGMPGPMGLKGDRGYTGPSGDKGERGQACKMTKQVAFSVARSIKLGPVLQDTTITFDNVFTNIGGAFDEYTSHFVCKTNGTYLFTTHVLGQNNKDVYAWIMLNNKHMVPLHADSQARYGTGSQSIILTLHKGDQVWMQLSKDSGLLNDYTTFTGFLLFELEGSPGEEEGESEISNHLPANSYDYWRWRK